MAYTIEEEQEINEIKTWWKENYKSIITIFVLTTTAVFGWRYWQDYQITKSQERSVQYQLAVANIGNDDASIEKFVQANEKTSYAVFALLDQAKAFVVNNDFNKAEVVLKQAVAQSTGNILVSISALRLATVQYQLGQYDQAINTLAKVKGDSWESAKLTLMGDIQFAKGDTNAARASFEKALEFATPEERAMIEVRFNSLP